MFIIKYLDGSFKEIVQLDVNSPDPSVMENVETVYQIGKEYVPVVVLKPKPKEQRDKIAKQTKPKK